MYFAQNELRERYVFFLSDSGVKQNYVSAYTSIPASVLSNFKYGKKELNAKSFRLLDEFLKTKTY